MLRKKLEKDQELESGLSGEQKPADEKLNAKHESSGYKVVDRQVSTSDSLLLGFYRDEAQRAWVCS